MKKKLIIIFITILILIEGIYVLLPTKRFKESIEKVDYKENKLDTSNSFAYYLGDGNGNYQEVEDRSQWPSKEEGYYFIKSVCYNGTGEIQDSEELINYNDDSHSAIITTKNSLHCDLYFDNNDNVINWLGAVDINNTLETREELEARNQKLTPNVSTDKLDTLRRYIGTYEQVENNFICFGIDNMDDCLANTDKYMYRIIGLDEQNNQIKILKATPILKDTQSEFMWDPVFENQVDWEESQLFNNFNSYFIDNSRYNYLQEEPWKNIMVSNPTWYIGNISTSWSKVSHNTETLFEYERSKIQTTTSTAGLMYVTDYLYACGGKEYSKWYSMYGKCWAKCENALNGKENTGSDEKVEELSKCYSEWSMGSFGGATQGWVHYLNWALQSGQVSSKDNNSAGYLRPVFYIKIDNIKLYGRGKLTNPFIIQLKQ